MIALPYRRRIGRRTRVVLNTTEIPSERIEEIVRFTIPPGVTGVLIEVRRAHRVRGGAAYTNSRSVGLRFEEEARYPRRMHPYQYGHLRGRRYWLASLDEQIVYLSAHELRHIWQRKARSRSGYFPMTRGRFSEIDAESYAIRKLREWRRRNSFLRTPKAGE